MKIDTIFYYCVVAKSLDFSIFTNFPICKRNGNLEKKAKSGCRETIFELRVHTQLFSSKVGKRSRKKIVEIIFVSRIQDTEGFSIIDGYRVFR